MCCFPFAGDFLGFLALTRGYRDKGTISTGSPFGALDMVQLGFSRVITLSGRGDPPPPAEISGNITCRRIAYDPIDHLRGHNDEASVISVLKNGPPRPGPGQVSKQGGVS